MAPNDKCAFCREHATLCNSHIIPEFVYRPLYDTKHRTLKIRTDAPTTYLQKGFRYTLLCGRCERFFSDRFEKPFKRLWYDKPILPQVAMRPKYKLCIPEYSAFKLFLLSVLWRASVCPVQPFASVDVGELEPALRSMLEAEDPGTASDFPIYAFMLLVPDRRLVAPLVMQPYSPGELQGSRVFVFIFGGCMWHFVVTTAAVPRAVDRIVLKETGMLLVQTVDSWNVRQLRDYFCKHFANAEEFGWPEPPSLR